MSSPRVKIRSVRLNVLVTGSDAVRVEDELIRREEEAAIEALDTLGPRRVVPRGHEGAPTAPSALMDHGERKVVGKSWRCVVAQEGLAQPFRLPSRYHAASSRADGHGAGTSQDLQLDGSALDTGDPEGDATIVDLIVAELLEECVGDLGETETLLGLDEQGHNGDAVEHNGAHLEV